MKRIIHKLLLPIIIAFLMIGLVMEPAYAQNCGIIVTYEAPLRIHQQPNTGSSTSGTTVKDSAVPILSASSGWFQVLPNKGVGGYSLRQYIKPVFPGDPEICGIVSTNSAPLNVRQQPNTSSQVLDTAVRDSALRILNQNNPSWDFVLLNNGIQGYASRQYITRVN